MRALFGLLILAQWVLFIRWIITRKGQTALDVVVTAVFWGYMLYDPGAFTGFLCGAWCAAMLGQMLHRYPRWKARRMIRRVLAQRAEQYRAGR